MNTSNQIFELPNYKSAQVSFGMARIDLDKLKRLNEEDIQEKYLKPNKHGYIPACRKRFTSELDPHCEEAYNTDPQIIEAIFTTKGGVGEELIAHRADRDILMVMHKYINKLPDSKRIFTDIYTTPDYDRRYPAHYFEDPKQLKLMADVVDQKTLKHILTHKEKRYCKSPMHAYENRDKMITAVLSLIDFKSDESIENSMSDIFLQKRKYDDGISINKYEDLKLLFDTFKDDKEFLDKFASTEKFAFDCIHNYQEIHMDLIHDSLKKECPETLYNLYKAASSMIFNFNGNKSKQMANHILDLVTNSDLNPDKSLSLLNWTEKGLKEFCDPKEYSLKDIDLIKNELEKTVERENRFKEIYG